MLCAIHFVSLTVYHFNSSRPFNLIFIILYGYEQNSIHFYYTRWDSSQKCIAPLCSWLPNLVISSLRIFNHSALSSSLSISLSLDFISLSPTVPCLDHLQLTRLPKAILISNHAKFLVLYIYICTMFDPKSKRVYCGFRNVSYHRVLHLYQEGPPTVLLHVCTVCTVGSHHIGFVMPFHFKTAGLHLK